MKLKTVASILLSSVVIFGCSSENTNQNTTENITEVDTVEVEKKPSVELPVNIFVNSDYDKFTGTKITFTRSIDSISISDFAEDEEISFMKSYGSTFDNYNLNLSENFKKMKMKMSHQFTANEEYKKRESFTLDKNTIFIAGDYELTGNEIVNKQLNFLSTDYKVGGTYEPTSEIEIAIPNEFITEHLQLKTIQQLDDEYKTIYIDLVKEK